MLIWSGGRVQTFEDGVVVCIQERKSSEFLGIITKILESNVVSVKIVRTFGAKASHFESIVHTSRAFSLRNTGKPLIESKTQARKGGHFRTLSG